jgi:hypothetical protein
MRMIKFFNKTRLNLLKNSLVCVKIKPSFFIGKDNPSLSEGIKSFRYGQKNPPMVK